MSEVGSAKVDLLPSALFKVNQFEIRVSEIRPVNRREAQPRVGQPCIAHVRMPERCAIEITFYESSRRRDTIPHLAINELAFRELSCAEVRAG